MGTFAKRRRRRGAAAENIGKLRPFVGAIKVGYLATAKRANRNPFYLYLGEGESGKISYIKMILLESLAQNDAIITRS